MNSLNFTGRLAADAEKRFTQNGTAILSFTVANDVGYGDRKQTNWYRCSIIGKRAESKLADYLVKGQQVACSGEHVLREYQKQDGTKGYSNDVTIREIDLVGGKVDSRAQNTNHAPQNQHASQPVPDNFDDDIPFANPYKNKEYMI